MKNNMKNKDVIHNMFAQAMSETTPNVMAPYSAVPVAPQQYAKELSKSVRITKDKLLAKNKINAPKYSVLVQWYADAKGNKVNVWIPRSCIFLDDVCFTANIKIYPDRMYATDIPNQQASGADLIKIIGA